MRLVRLRNSDDLWIYRRTGARYRGSDRCARNAMQYGSVTVRLDMDRRLINGLWQWICGTVMVRLVWYGTVGAYGTDTRAGSVRARMRYAAYRTGSSLDTVYVWIKFGYADGTVRMVAVGDRTNAVAGPDARRIGWYRYAVSDNAQYAQSGYRFVRNGYRYGPVLTETGWTMRFMRGRICARADGYAIEIGFGRFAVARVRWWQSGCATNQYKYRICNQQQNSAYKSGLQHHSNTAQQHSTATANTAQQYTANSRSDRQYGSVRWFLARTSSRLSRAYARRMDIGYRYGTINSKYQIKLQFKFKFKFISQIEQCNRRTQIVDRSVMDNIPIGLRTVCASRLVVTHMDGFTLRLHTVRNMQFGGCLQLPVG